MVNELINEDVKRDLEEKESTWVSLNEACLILLSVLYDIPLNSGSKSGW